MKRFDGGEWDSFPADDINMGRLGNLIYAKYELYNAKNG